MKQPTSRCLRCHEESGAVLLLALIFVIVMSVTLLAIVNFAGDALINTANLKGQRALEYSADAATDAAIQTVRYSYYAFDGTTNASGDCVPDGTVLILPDTATMPAVNGSTMTVTCSGVINRDPVTHQPQQNTRTVTFTTCEQATCTNSNAIIVAIVTFQDYSTAGIYKCTSAPDSATCGTGDIVQSWIEKTANQ